MPSQSALAVSVVKQAPQIKTLTFADRVAYQRAIEEVYWRNRIWPQERPDPKPSLDKVMSQAQIEKKVEDYLRDSQALENYWQKPITPEQLQAEMERMAHHTRQPEVLREIFAALGNDPYVIAECLARPALADRLARNLYAHDERFHGELKRRAVAALAAHHSVKEMKQTGGTYSEVEWVKIDKAEAGSTDSTGVVATPLRGIGRDVPPAYAEATAARQARGNSQKQDRPNAVKLDSTEWNENVEKLATAFDTSRRQEAAAFGVRRLDAAFEGVNKSPHARDVTQSFRTIPVGKLSSLQEDEGAYHVTAVINKSKDRLKLATVAWMKQPFDSWRAKADSQMPLTMAAVVAASYRLPAIGGPAITCTDDTWTATNTTNAPSARFSHTAVWTGSEMIVWGGTAGSGVYFNTGARYNPSTDNWTATSTTNAPTARDTPTAVWTGTVMIVWGGFDGSVFPNTGGRYNPGSDGWTATSTTNAPPGRVYHTAVWTGSVMIVWGGQAGLGNYFNTGGRYNPGSDSWTATTITNAPTSRYDHTAVWTGSAMIVWGGYNGSILNTGGRYNPVTDSWMATGTTNAPVTRYLHTAVWTGSEMIVWGGGLPDLNTGGRYTPSTDSWTATSTTNAPTARDSHTAVWTGSEMIVWGGGFPDLNTGGRYNASTDSWTATSTTNAPDARELHTAVWTGSEMIVWGGNFNENPLNTGGRYCAQAPAPTLGNYPNTSLPLSTDATVTPDAPPTNTTSISVSSLTDFAGTLVGDPVTGLVRLTDAHPAGTYPVTVRAFNGGGPPVIKSFMLTVTTPVTCTPVSFAGAVNFGTGNSPRSVAVGDFNGDGNQDLAVANSNSNNVSILLGDGTGNFSAATNPGAGTSPWSVAVGDFNGDGKQDLAVANEGSANVSILLGNGDGTFQPAVNFGTGSGPVSVAVGDFNGDGKQDLAVANQFSNNVSILLGNGDGTFQAAVNYGASVTPSSVAVGDFNDDGNQDLAVTNTGSDNVSILLGNGDGTFQPAVNYGTGPGPFSIAVGDFNGDSAQDLAVANGNSNNVSILLGNGNGTFQAAVNYGAGSLPESVAVGDFNGDGNQDLAVADELPANVSILLGDGAGHFSAPTNFGAGSGPISVAVGDFNGDAKQDLAVANGASSTNVSILLRNCAPTPTPTATFTPTPTPTPTFTPTSTATFTPTPTATATFTPTPTATATSTPSGTPAATATATPSIPPTPTATATFTPNPTPTATVTPTSTPTPTPTPTPIPAPAITTNPATNVAIASATLNGSVNPHGSTTIVYFQWGPTTSYGHTTTSQSRNGNTTQNVTWNITALDPNRTYHFRLVGTNNGGTRYGSDRIFTTLRTGPPVVITNGATNIARFSATLNGSVNPHGSTTIVYFQWGPTTSYGHTTTSQSRNGNTTQNVTRNITALDPNRTYHFRLVGTNNGGTRYGSDRIFTTLRTGPPVVITNGATNIARFSATLNGSVNPHGSTTIVYFQWGPTTSYGHTTTTQTRTGDTSQNVTAILTGLSPGNKYHLRIVATNSAGTRYGSDSTFTTLRRPR